MISVLFLNPRPERCGVHQYGRRFYSIIHASPKLRMTYQDCPDTIDPSELNNYDVVIYNLHPGIPNAILSAPYPTRARQVAVYHDGGRGAPFDLWLFSDPSATSEGNLRIIGRPLPYWNPLPPQFKSGHVVTIGLSGLVGAWATTMVETVRSQMPEARVRLHLAASDHCDPSGGLAFEIGNRCKSYFGNPNQIEVTHDFLEERQVLGWLEANDLNCYIRTPAACSGISSAMDMALAVHRPIAINNHPMFRHLASVSPEICVENTPLSQIIELGQSPLIKHYQRNSRAVVQLEVEEAIESLLLSKPQ